MADLMRDAAWVLTIAFALSLVYELYRATTKAGVSRHDSMPAFVSQLPLYGIAAVVIVFLFLGFAWAAWLGLVFALGMILVSILYYNPRIMLDRQPDTLDWIEDLIFTGLLFVAATQLTYEVLAKSLA
jgi:hypothetical protein